jgi:hypothetical protein
MANGMITMKKMERFLRIKSVLVMLGIFALVGFAHPIVMAQNCQDYMTIAEEGGIYTVNLNNIPNDVSSFGFDLVYPEAELEYVSYSIDGCPSWNFFMLNPTPCEAGVCSIKAGGFGITPLPSGTSDCLVHLEYTIKNPSFATPQICIVNLVDDMELWCDGCGDADCPHCCCGPEIVCDNGIGDACECEADFDCDGNVDADDLTSFLTDIGRSILNNPCTNDNPCNGDFECDTDVDADDVNTFLEDFARSPLNNPCPFCAAGDWCSY